MRIRTGVSAVVPVMLTATLLMALGGPARSDTYATRVWPSFEAMLGAPDGARTAELYPEGVDIYLGFDTPILDLPGDDFRILEIEGVADNYEVWATADESEPYVTLVDLDWVLIDGAASGTQSFDLADSGLAEVRWIRLVGLDGGDGPEFDAIEDLHSANYATAIWPTFTEMIGAPDGGRTSELYPSGRAVYVGFETPIVDLPGEDDFRVHEIVGVADDYEVWGTDDESEPYVTLVHLEWVLIGVGSGTESFDLAGTGLVEVGWIKLVGLESGDGPEFDAITVFNDLMEPYQLTFEPDSEISPAWAPDNTAIAYSRVVGTERTIWTIDLATDSLTQVTYASGSGQDYAPFWSPDSDTIGFHSDDGLADTGIWKVDRDGGEPVLCTDFVGAHDEEADWSPDGAWIAYNRARPGSNSLDEDIFIVSRDCGEVYDLVNEGGDALIEDQRPSWSPEGRRVAFTRGPVGARFICAYDLDYPSSGVPVAVGSPDTLTLPGATGSCDFYPVNGAFITYDYEGDIWIAASYPGGARWQITSGPAMDRTPAWSPDGSTIVFDSSPGEGEPFDLWTIQVELPVTAVDPDAVEPTALPRLVLYPSRPNPLTTSTRVPFELYARAPITLKVYSANGRLVRTLVDAVLDAGAHTVRWDSKDEAGRAVASGIYYLRIAAPGVTEARKLTLLR